MIKIKAEIPIINIEIPRGNARRFEVTVTADGKPFDLSTANLKMMVVPSTGGMFEATANIKVAENVLTLEFPPEFSKNVKWRRAKYDILNVSTRHTLIRGEICLLEVVTSYLKVRRKNDTVMYQFGGLSWGWFGIVRRNGPGYSIQPSDRERNVFILGLQGIPQGFRSEFSLIGGIYNDKGVPYGTWYLGGPSDGNMIRFQFTDPVPTDRDIGDIRVSSIMYLTNDPWPTRLP